MPTRFDHAVIAVRDLDAGIKRYQRLGFDVLPGGRHTGRGTHNALFRFGLDYVELLAVYDENEARANNSIGRGITNLLTDQTTSLIGYALATTTIEQDAQRFRGTDAELPRPNAMSRKRPDGQQLSWRTLAPGGVSWGRPWPFLIQWDTPDEQRLQIDLPGTHPNGATHWVQTPNSDGQAQQILSEKGEGPFALTFSVGDLKQTHTFLKERGIKFTAETGKLILDPEETGGVLMHFIR